MTISSVPITANLRMLDADDNALRTLGRIRSNINSASVNLLFAGFNQIMVVPATSAVMTEQRELALS